MAFVGIPPLILAKPAGLILWRHRGLRDMLGEPTDWALEKITEPVEVIGRRVIPACVRDFGKGGPVNTGRLRNLFQCDSATVFELLVGDHLFQSETDHT